MNFIELQNRLQNLIKTKKIRQADIARGLGSSTSNLSQKFTNSKSEVTISDIEKVQEFFGVKLYVRTDEEDITVTGNSLERQNDTTVRERLNKIGWRLQKIQEKNEYLDKDMAKLLHISEDEYIDIKCGDTLPPIEAIIRLKQCFKISVDWLLYGEGCE